MELVDRIKSMFSGKKRLDKINIDELRKERIRLEQIEQRVGKEVDNLERRKQELFVKGTEESSQRQQIGLARKIKELDASARAKDQQLAMISRQMRIISGFMMLKENQALVKDMGVSSIISRMDIGELQSYVERAMVEGQFQMERFAEILKTIEVPEGMAAGVSEDADTLAIVAAMEEAKSAQANGPEEAVESGLKKVGEILGPKDEEAPEASI